MVFSMARARNLSGLCENSTGHGERLPAHDAATIDVNGIQGAFALPIPGLAPVVTITHREHCGIDITIRMLVTQHQPATLNAFGRCAGSEA